MSSASTTAMREHMHEHRASAYARASTKRYASAHATDVRTDGLTQKNKICASFSPNASRTNRAPMSIPTKPVVTTEFLDRWAERERAKLLRTGDRDPISPMLRMLVHRRDGWRCQVCGHVPWRREESRQGRDGAMQLDHIRPWSSFKPGDPACDRSDNLRTVCAACNEQRSNFVSRDDKPATPIVKVCTPCLVAIEPRYEKLGQLPDRFDVWCGKMGHDSWAARGWKIV